MFHHSVCLVCGMNYLGPGPQAEDASPGICPSDLRELLQQVARSLSEPGRVSMGWAAPYRNWAAYVCGQAPPKPLANESPALVPALAAERTSVPVPQQSQPRPRTPNPSLMVAGDDGDED